MFLSGTLRFLCCQQLMGFTPVDRDGADAVWTFAVSCLADVFSGFASYRHACAPSLLSLHGPLTFLSVQKSSR